MNFSHTAPGAPATAPDPLDASGMQDRAMVDAFIAASRALVAVAARSLATLDDDVTLAQYRSLVVLRTRGPRRAADLAEALGVTPGTASRMIERLVRKHLVRRVRSRADRRIVYVQLTESGHDVVDQVTEHRRGEVERILAHMPSRGRKALTSTLRTFADAAGEVPEQDWALGWGS